MRCRSPDGARREVAPIAHARCAELYRRTRRRKGPWAIASAPPRRAARGLRGCTRFQLNVVTSTRCVTSLGEGSAASRSARAAYLERELSLHLDEALEHRVGARLHLRVIAASRSRGRRRRGRAGGCPYNMAGTCGTPVETICRRGQRAWYAAGLRCRSAPPSPLRSAAWGATRGVAHAVGPQLSSSRSSTSSGAVVASARSPARQLRRRRHAAARAGCAPRRPRRPPACQRERQAASAARRAAPLSASRAARPRVWRLHQRPAARWRRLL